MRRSPLEQAVVGGQNKTSRTLNSPASPGEFSIKVWEEREGKAPSQLYPAGTELFRQGSRAEQVRLTERGTPLGVPMGSFRPCSLQQSRLSRRGASVRGATDQDGRKRRRCKRRRIAERTIACLWRLPQIGGALRAAHDHLCRILSPHLCPTHPQEVFEMSSRVGSALDFERPWR
jgi:hypothetical protein